MTKKLSLVILFCLFCISLNFCGKTAGNKSISGDTLKPVKNYDTITISATGDLMCHEPEIKDARTNDGYDFTHMFELIKPYIEKADLAFGNFETVLAGADKKFTGYPTFNSPDEFAEAIKFAGFDALTTANNHCLDRSFAGVQRTANKLNELGFIQTGTFANEDESNTIPIINEKGVKIAFLAYTFGTNGISTPSGKEFSVNYINTVKIGNDVKSARALGCDIVIAFMHWGEEYQRTPNKSQVKVAEEMINAGVDIILGSHPHVIQPMETRTVAAESGKTKKIFIIYSMGNFLSNQRKKYTDSGVIVNLRLIKDLKTGIVVIDKVSFVPTYVSLISGKYTILPVWKSIQAVQNKMTDSPYYFPSDYSRLKEVWSETTNHLTNEECNIYPDEE